MLDLHLLLGQQACEIDQQAAGHHDRALTFDLSVKRRAQRELHIGRGQVQRTLLGLEEHAGEDLDSSARRDGAGDDAEPLCEVVA